MRSVFVFIFFLNHFGGDVLSKQTPDVSTSTRQYDLVEVSYKEHGWGQISLLDNDAESH